MQKTSGQQETAIAPSLSSDWQSIRNLLVMRLDNIGDVIMTSPTLRAIKETLPNTKITYLASPAGSVVASLLPEVDAVLTWRVLWQDLGRLKFDPTREWELIQTLKSHQFDAAIILTSFSQSPHPAALICALADIPFRLGESKEWDWQTLTHAATPLPDEVHQVDRNLHLIESVGFQVRDRRLSLNIPVTPLSLPEAYIVLNPWASCQARMYPPQQFATAARRLSEATGWSVVLTGVDRDRNRSQPLLEILGACAIDLIGQTTLTELIALVASARLIFTNNTSTLHIADATNTPSVILYSGTDLESQWQPRHSPFRLLRRPTTCSPCYRFTCPYELQCLDILPETVFEAAQELLQSLPRTPQGRERSNDNISLARRNSKVITGID